MFPTLFFTELSGNEFTRTALTGRDSTGDVGSLPCPLRCNAFAISLCTSTTERTYETVVAVLASSALGKILIINVRKQYVASSS